MRPHPTHTEAAKRDGESLFERALRELRTALLAGDHAPGSRLSEAATAARLGLSRTPIREALSRLVEEGLLRRTPSGRYEVSAITRRDVLDAIDLRGVMEGTATRLAAERGAPADGIVACRRLIDEIDDALGASAADIDFARYEMLNARLHDELLDLAQSPMTAREARRVAALPFAGPSAFVQGQSAAPSTLRTLFAAQDQHRAILDAIEAREGARAEAIAREHARLASRNLDSFLSGTNAQTKEAAALSLVRKSTEGSLQAG